MVAFGMQLPIQSQSTIFVQPWEPAAGVPELVQVTQACEAAGFDYVAVCDHVAIPSAQAEAMSTTWWDTVATLSYLAAVTERVRLLSHVFVLPYRHPLAVAKAWATLDQLSGGRAILGVGTGHVEGEFDALGVPFADRGRLLDEAIDAVRAALADEFVSHHGERWTFGGVGQRPRPVQPAVPIWVGGSSKPAMRRAAERGDGWLPQGPPRRGDGGRASTSSAAIAPPPAATNPSCSARCRGRSTSVIRAGRRHGACAARPRRSPATSAPTRSWVWTRSRWASSAARPMSCATRSPPSPPTSRHS